MYQSKEKEVYFDVYCPVCEHWLKTEEEPPCCDCMEERVAVDSHMPIYYKKAEGKKSSRK